MSSRPTPETYTDIADELHALEQRARQIEAIHKEDNSLGFPVAELHCHYGTSVSPEQLWRQYIRVGTKILIRGQRIIDSRNLPGLIQISPDDPREMTPYFKEIYHPVLDKLTTGVEPARASFEAIFSGAYSIGIDKLEVRTNPMKHNAGDEYDLDELIEGMSDGMRQAFKLHPQLYGGVILCIAREWENTGDAKADQRGFVRNSKIIEKAIKHADSGIVGIDIAGPDHTDGLPFPVGK
ncbi:hypothetical protein KBD87_04455, partial [Candidatus Saccharibacteria bacterium]|nr:hypothetical protein [Candidatus Saccharibacteria bacterium]